MFDHANHVYGQSSTPQNLIPSAVCNESIIISVYKQWSSIQNTMRIYKSINQFLFFWLVISTHLKNMLVKLEIFPILRGEISENYSKPTPSH